MMETRKPEPLTLEVNYWVKSVEYTSVIYDRNDKRRRKTAVVADALAPEGAGSPVCHRKP